MSGWKSLVAGVDFTPCSASAIQQAIRIAERNQAALHVVHVIETLVVMDLDEALKSIPDRHPRGAHPGRGQGLEKVHGRCRGRERARIRRGDRPPGVRDPAPGAGAGRGLLILGTHGNSPSDRGAGTLATACARKAMASVLLVKDPHTRPFRSIVACVDFSATSRKALELAIRIAAHDGAILHVLHVFNAPWHRLHNRAPTPQASPDYRKQYRDGLRRRLEAFCEPLHGEMAQLETRYAVFDCPGHGQGITEFVKQVGGDLVVLGTRGRTNLREMLLGSTAERVVRDASCSILAVRPGWVRAPARTVRRGGG